MHFTSVGIMPQLPDVPLEGLYGDVIMDHYRNPRHRSPVRDADVEAHEFNPVCGDEVTLQIKLDDQGHVVEVGSIPKGCAIIQASASMMAEIMAGKTPTELLELSHQFRDLMHGESIPDDSIRELGDLEALEVVRQRPVRIHCVLLPWTALEEGVKNL
jgi:nitrogen fixation protein NifU and related proteins